MKVIQKYFLALVPPPDILKKAQEIKTFLKDQFGIKYALKSPPHITLKMPFSYNESKVDILEQRLTDFLKIQKPFKVKIEGVGTFGQRVVFLGIEKSPELISLQSGLKIFCKKELHLVDELSDRNYHPHLTVAFKDLKGRQFEEILDIVRKRSFRAWYTVEDLALLKRVDQKWIIDRKITFGG
jgi:2'-5' RNA ligase